VGVAGPGVVGWRTRATRHLRGPERPGGASEGHGRARVEEPHRVAALASQEACGSGVGARPARSSSALRDGAEPPVAGATGGRAWDRCGHPGAGGSRRFVGPAARRAPPTLGYGGCWHRLLGAVFRAPGSAPVVRSLRADSPADWNRRATPPFQRVVTRSGCRPDAHVLQPRSGWRRGASRGCSRRSCARSSPRGGAAWRWTGCRALRRAERGPPARVR
jgi:hypothetical protein